MFYNEENDIDVKNEESLDNEEIIESTEDKKQEKIEEIVENGEDVPSSEKSSLNREKYIENVKNIKALIAKGDFSKSIGAEFNWRDWAIRSKRYTMLIEAGVVKKLVVEEGKCELTAAENFLESI